ncbi:MAG: hypothetical protein HON53_08495 [Planctomycetaceae bacterium]|nr:hypothetical protein [Planctomycetaceae bacterium]
MPVGRSNRNGGDRSVSMGGLLAFLVGFGLLLAYWLFSDLTKNFSQWERWAFVGTTSFLSLWGLKQMTEVAFPPLIDPQRVRES